MVAQGDKVATQTLRYSIDVFGNLSSRKLREEGHHLRADRRGWCAGMWRLTPLVLLAACTQVPAGPCRMQAMADLPTTLDKNGLMVTGRVEGSDTSFKIDTAAEQTALTPATAQLLARTGPSSGDAFAEIALGNADFQRQVPVVNITGAGGVIGGDLLSDHDLELDLPDHRVRLWRAPGCKLADLPWTGPRDAVPVKVTRGELLRVPVTLNGQKVEAVLDSEAPISLIRTDTARRLGVTSSELGRDARVAVHDGGRGSTSTRMHRFDTLTVGQEQVKNPLIGVANFQPATGDMVLGLDYLRDHRVWVSYRTGHLFIQAARPAAMADGVLIPTPESSDSRADSPDRLNVNR
jgi:predicted aspartyl protease